MDALTLLLLDSRAPAGGHAHSGGMEPAVTAGLVHDLADAEAFCRARLRTSGRVAAAFAAASYDRVRAHGGGWDELDREYDARLPSAALRQASRQLGNGLRRLLRSMFPHEQLPWPASPPHHPIALGLGVALAGGTRELAGEAALLAAITAPATAAVRLLGLDPLAVHAMLGRLARELEPVPAGVPRDLPADGAPWLDLLADVHHTEEVRLFAS